METTNTPYVKKFNELGQCTNPIKEVYTTGASDRKSRRSFLSKVRFFGNGKNIPLTVLYTSKYLRVRQYEKDKDGNKKIIEHYILQ